jgi:hypothetical protein
VTLLVATPSTIPPQAALVMATPAGAPSNSDTVQAAPNLALLVSGGAGGTLLINTPPSKDVYGVTTADISVTIAASSLRLVALPADLADSSGLISFGATGCTYRPVTL